MPRLPDIKTCPCCKDNAEAIMGYAHHHYVQCTNQKCGIGTPYCDTKLEAIKRWNRREQ